MPDIRNLCSGKCSQIGSAHAPALPHSTQCLHLPSPGEMIADVNLPAMNPYSGRLTFYMYTGTEPPCIQTQTSYGDRLGHIPFDLSRNALTHHTTGEPLRGEGLPASYKGWQYPWRWKGSETSSLGGVGGIRGSGRESGSFLVMVCVCM